MLLKIIHTTDLAYTDLISETVMELRMCPRQEDDQRRLSYDLAIGPPTGVTSYFDWLGNSVHAFTVNAFHKQLKIISTSIVEQERIAPDPHALPDRWPARLDGDYTIYDYLQFGGPVVDGPLLRQLLDSLRPRQGMPLGELAMAFLRLIDAKFHYEKGITTAASPITDVLQHRRGVCQDFTHLMIGLARAAGIPARYVSGFLYGGATSTPAEAAEERANGKSKAAKASGEARRAKNAAAAEADRQYRGAAQTHAWCELMFPQSGWVGFDPTNNCVVGNQFVKVAVGRHYADVAPNRGTWRGNAEEAMKVSVKSEELPTIPAALAAERMQALSIPTYVGKEAGREAIRQLEEQQQQQQ